MCREDGEGTGVSASSCVTRLISPQPGRLGPEGSGGGRAGLHSPSDKYVFGAAVLKGHGGEEEEEGWSTPCCAAGSPVRSSMGCVTPSRGMMRCREMAPSSDLTHSTHSHVQREMLLGALRYSNSSKHTSPRPPIPRQRLKWMHKDGLVES